MADASQTTTEAKCKLCGDPMPPGEEMFNFHGFSGPCPKPPLPTPAPMELPLELALVRLSVVHLRWHDTGGSIPSLTAFLAGWCTRCIGASEPQEVGTLRDSFRAGWKEAGDQLVIASRVTDQ